MADPLQEKPPLSTGMFYMWRSLVAIAWADGNCCEEETKFFAKVFDNLGRYFDLTQEQRDALADDLEHAKNIDELISHINEPEPRALLVVYAHDLVMLDGVLDPNEDAIIKKLDLWEQPAYDREALRGEIQVLIAQRRRENEEDKEKVRAMITSGNPIIAAVDRLFRALGMDLID